MLEMNLPFQPTEIHGLFTDEDSGRRYVTYAYSCPELLPNGRCGIYENRPNVCRDYKPGTDALCVFSNAGVLREGVRREMGLPRMSKRRLKLVNAKASARRAQAAMAWDTTKSPSSPC